MRPSNPVLINAHANTGTVYSNAIPSDFIMSGSIQANFSDAGAGGTLTLQGSNDPPTGLLRDASGNFIPINWDTVKNGSISASAVVASGALTTISMQWLNYKWLRVKWVQSAAAGTFTVNGFFQGAN